MKRRPIYFDYMATTPVDARVIEKMNHYLGFDGVFGNPASMTHAYGKAALKAVEAARGQIAEAIHAKPEEIVFTSGATESDNLAILGASRFYQRKGKHLITMATEHKAVLSCFHQLEQEGFTVSYLNPQSDGILQLEHLASALTPETILVSIMHVNNEIGVIQDIQAIGEFLHKKGIIFHVDAAQSAGKIAINMQQLPVDLMSFSGHKIYGPKGIGALYVRQKPRIRLQPQSFGGDHERGLRAGTLATHQIVGMGEAFAIAEACREEESEHLFNLREQLWKGINHIPGICLNGHRTKRIAGNLNISFATIQPESLLFALQDLAISTTSACSSAVMQPSYVLKALGLNDELAYSAIRLSLGRFTTADDIQYAIQTINQQLERLHAMVPR